MPWWRRRVALGSMIVLGSVMILGFVPVNLLYKPFRIPSESMRPNLLVGDYFYARRLGADTPIARGDVIVFAVPGGSTDHVARCVGLPGDVVEVRDGVTLVNDAPFESALDDSTADHSCLARSAATTCPEPHTLLESRGLHQGQFNETFGPVAVPADHLFVMGDNRYNAADSRYFGPVPRDRVKCRAAFIYWSWDSPGGLRPGRLFRRIR